MATILIVEDHAMSRQMLMTLLGYYHHKMIEAPDGATGLALARAERPDVIITDIVMPNIDGLELIRQLRCDSDLNKIPVILYTATYRVPEARRLIEGLGRCTVIPKPSEPRVIIENVHAVLGIPIPEIGAQPGDDSAFPSLLKSNSFRSAGLQLATLMDLSFHILIQRDTDQLINVYCSAARSILNCQYTQVGLIQKDGDFIYFGDDTWNPAKSDSLPFREILNTVVTKRQIMRWPGIIAEGTKGKENDSLRPMYGSFLAIPFATSVRVYGCTCLAKNSKESFFSEEEEEMVLVLSGQTALAYENLLMIRNLTQNVHELESANKELEAFIYSVAHDLRAPLRSIRGYSELLIDAYADKFDNKGRRYLCRVINGADQMNQIIEDLLHLSRISRHEIHRHNINMSALAETVIADICSENKERLVAVDIAGGVSAFADSGLTQLVLSNLLGNAWKFTAKTPDARIEFGAFDRDGKTVYYVRDNGAGFDQQYADRIFLPFHRLHKEQDFEGTGIGLAIAERVVRRHGGEIWAEGKVNEGGAFFFTLN